MFLCALPAFLAHLVVAAWVGIGLVAEDGEGGRLATRVFLHALTAWGAAFLLLIFDPFSALYVFLD